MTSQKCPPEHPAGLKPYPCDLGIIPRQISSVLTVQSAINPLFREDEPRLALAYTLCRSNCLLKGPPAPGLHYAYQ
jgi:hypothetical protein